MGGAPLTCGIALLLLKWKLRGGQCWLKCEAGPSFPLPVGESGFPRPHLSKPCPPQPPLPAGTGPLEADEQMLAAAGGSLPRNQRHALLYRMGQKALARAYLVHAKKLLQREMAHLAALQ